MKVFDIHFDFFSLMRLTFLTWQELLDEMIKLMLCSPEGECHTLTNALNVYLL